MTKHRTKDRAAPLVSQRRRVLGRWLLVLGYAGGIFALSALPGDNLPSLGASDKLIHAVEFGILAILVCRAVAVQMPMRSRFVVALISILIAILYGATDEAHQLLVAYRSAEFADLAADGTGAILVGWGWLKAGARWTWLQ